MKKLMLVLIILPILGCVKDSSNRNITKINNTELELLFEKDGCKMYRFFDAPGGRYLYWSICQGKSEYSHIK